jgi:hypothetical protein
MAAFEKHKAKKLRTCFHIGKTSVKINTLDSTG